MNIAYLLFGKSIKRKLAEGQLRPKGFEGMKPCWIGTDAMQYYTWAQPADMPPSRFKEMESLVKWMSAGITRENIDEIVGEQERILFTKVLKAKNDDERAKGIAHAVKLGEELRIRSKEAVPEKLWYAMIAVCVAREDEDPGKLDAVNYSRTQKMLAEASEAGQGFFLTTPIFQRLLGESLTTENALQELRTSWTMQRARLTAVLDISSEGSSRNTRKTSTASSSVLQEQPVTPK